MRCAALGASASTQYIWTLPETITAGKAVRVAASRLSAQQGRQVLRTRAFDVNCMPALVDDKPVISGSDHTATKTTSAINTREARARFQ